MQQFLQDLSQAVLVGLVILAVALGILDSLLVADAIYKAVN